MLFTYNWHALQLYSKSKKKQQKLVSWVYNVQIGFAVFNTINSTANTVNIRENTSAQICEHVQIKFNCIKANVWW